MKKIPLTHGKFALVDDDYEQYDGLVYIYALCDPRDEAVRYVGKSSAPEARLRGHLRNLDATTHKRRWINSLVTIGLQPTLNILQVTNEDEWISAERYWIAFYKALGADLVNTDSGGRGRPKGSKHSQQARHRISEALRGHQVSQETRKKLSIANSGRVLSQEHREKLSEAAQERWTKATELQRQRTMSNLVRVWTPEMKMKASQSRQGRKRGKTSSQYLGVAWFKRDSTWRAYIYVNSKQRHLGFFAIEEDAAKAYDKAAKEYFGEFARLNFPDKGVEYAKV